MTSKVNLHMHTTHSDGGKTVAEVLEGLRNSGVRYFAITDHDKVQGNVEAARLAKCYGLTHSNGVELSCHFDGEGGLDESYMCHIVGLGFDLSRMQAALSQIEKRKDEILRLLVCELEKSGYCLFLGNIVNSENRISERKAIANELVRQGYVKSVSEAFDAVLNTKKFGEYIKCIPSVKEGIAIIHDCGGFAVWAHPFYATRGGKKPLSQLQVSEAIKQFVAYKLDGIEAYYQKFNREQISFLITLAESNHLFKSIATDYHGAEFDERAYPELIPIKAMERLAFDAHGFTVDEAVVEILFQGGTI